MKPQPKCTICNLSVYVAEQFQCFGALYHVKCFRCSYCKQALRWVCHHFIIEGLGDRFAIWRLLYSLFRLVWSSLKPFPSDFMLKIMPYLKWAIQNTVQQSLGRKPPLSRQTLVSGGLSLLFQLLSNFTQEFEPFKSLPPHFWFMYFQNDHLKAVRTLPWIL